MSFVWLIVEIAVDSGPGFETVPDPRTRELAVEPAQVLQGPLPGAYPCCDVFTLWIDQSPAGEGSG